VNYGFLVCIAALGALVGTIGLVAIRFERRAAERQRKD
jgi:hypothetical protein